MLAAFEASGPTQQDTFFTGTHRSSEMRAKSSGDEGASPWETSSKTGGAVHGGPDDLVSYVAALVGEVGVRNPGCDEIISAAAVPLAGENAQAVAFRAVSTAGEARGKRMVVECGTGIGRL